MFHRKYALRNMYDVIKQFYGKPFYIKLQKIREVYYLLKTKIWYSQWFKCVGNKSKIIKPLGLSSPENISVGSNVTINPFCWLFTKQLADKIPEFIIKDRVRIGHFNHITCINKVCIEKDVITADRVYITDNMHEYENVEIPIMSQPIVSKGEVHIGEGSWIGENASIISCKIGKHCVIGANTVVNKDIPNYSVAVGVPAKIVKRYHFEDRKWYRKNH